MTTPHKDETFTGTSDKGEVRVTRDEKSKIENLQTQIIIRIG